MRDDRDEVRRGLLACWASQAEAYDGRSAPLRTSGPAFPALRRLFRGVLAALLGQK